RLIDWIAFRVGNGGGQITLHCPKLREQSASNQRAPHSEANMRRGFQSAAYVHPNPATVNAEPIRASNIEEDPQAPLAFRVMYPLWPPHPNIAHTRRIIGAAKTGAVDPFAGRRQQFFVLQRNLDRRLRPGRMPDAKAAAFVPATRKRAVPLQQKDVERFMFARLKP